MDSQNDIQPYRSHSDAGAGTQRGIARIVIVEDDSAMRELLATALRKKGYDALEFYNVYRFVHAVEIHEAVDFDLIISDIRMPGYSGFELLEIAINRKWNIPIIIITAFGNAETHSEAESLGAVAIFDKPFDIDDLLMKVQSILSSGNGGNPSIESGQSGH